MLKPAKHDYRWTDFGILAAVAVYITFTNLLTCCCSNSMETISMGAPGNPQQKKKKKKSITAHPGRGILSTREMGLKCQHLPRLSHIHQFSPSPPWPCVGLPSPSLGPGYLCIQSSELNFSSFLESDTMHAAGQRNWIIHFLEKSSQYPFSLAEKHWSLFILFHQYIRTTSSAQFH